MEKRTIVLLLCFMCLLVQGCVSVTTYKMAPEVLAGQKKIDREGIEAVLSYTKDISVFIRPVAGMYSAEDKPVLVIGVSGEKELNLSPENIEAYVDGNPSHILTHDELLADVKNRHEAAVDAVKQQYNARSRQISESSMKSADDPDVFEPNPGQRNAVGNDNYGYKLDGKALGQGMVDLERQRAAEMESIEKETKKEIEELNAYLLRKTTIQPHTWYRGKIKMAKIPDVGKPHEIKLLVSVAGEEHQFVIKTSAVK